jgi:hypothetical protein
MDHISEAVRMLEAFIGAGAHEFDVTRTVLVQNRNPAEA